VNEQAKRVVVIAIAIVAVAIAGYSAYHFTTADQLQKGVTMPSPSKSMAQMERERMAQEDAKVNGARTGR
jgi:hypothetical protein